MIRRRGRKRPRRRVHPAKPKTVLRATRPNEYWQIDATVIRLTTGIRIYLQAVIDNFSRRILAWRVSDTLSSATTRELLIEASKGLPDDSATANVVFMHQRPAGPKHLHSHGRCRPSVRRITVSRYNVRMSGKHQGPDIVQDVSPESVEVITVRLRSLIADEKTSSARQLADASVRQHPHSEKLKAFREALYPGDATRTSLRDSSHRANMEWLTQHQEEHRGKWVALLDGKLVATDSDLGELMATLSPLGSDRRPLIHHVPK